MESQVAKNTSNCRVYSVSLSDNYAAIAQLLQHQLLSAIDVSGMGIGATELPSDVKLTPETIPMHRLSDETHVVYRSAIALKLAPLWQWPPLDIANWLTGCLPIMSRDTTTRPGLDFSVEVAFPGWISFRLGNRGLATWLQQLIQRPVLTSNSSNSQLSENLFPAQYAHARCCSLLRLAHSQGLVKLRDLEFKTLNWQLVEPNPIPWLNATREEGTDQVSLRLVHSAERLLIAQLLDLQDAIADPGRVNGLKQASALSNAFEGFYSSCRIWGEVKTQTPELAQARLGLVAVTQASLRSLLQDQLGVSAPVDL